MLAHDRTAGKAAGIRSGIAVARAPVCALLDGDGQNDPAFLKDLLDAIEAGGERTGLAQGQRVGRKDGRLKSLQSRIATGSGCAS